MEAVAINCNHLVDFKLAADETYQEGWGEGNGHGGFHYQGWQLAMPVRIN